MELWGDHSDVESDSEWVRKVSANGVSMKTTEVEAKLDQGNIQEAEASLREGLSLNFEVLSLFFYFFSIFIFKCSSFLDPILISSFIKMLFKPL